MTRVCLVGDPDVTLQYELLSRETSREALSTYDLERPFDNSLAVRTVSVGAAVSLCNDLQWYIVRFVDEVLIQEPSVSDEEWLSRELAEALRNGVLEPEATGEFLKIYGVEDVESTAAVPGDDRPRSANAAGPSIDSSAETDDSGPGDDGDAETDGTGDGERHSPDAPSFDAPTRRLVEPLYVRRTGAEIPAYDLRDVDETLVVRISEDEYAP